ncbi:MAG: RNB domain-containing ribonuclease [Betaproteobacteria bacterium]|nr:MAG: RNB domain-containing ribonuclease [Betaproteobacteria bacterium]
MNVLYEEDGEFKVGAVLSRAPASVQVESPHGRRSKIKTAQLLLEFERPPGAELLAGAERFAEGLDTDFLWQCCADTEFGFRDLAREYVGREPAPVESAGVLFKLHAAPMYFYRRGRGRYQAAPQATLKLALAALERKKRVLEQVAAWAAALARFSCPAEIAALRDELLYAPDRAKPETKAFEQACRETGLSAARLLERCGLVPDTHALHLNRFVHEFFPQGADFPAHAAPAPPADLPAAVAEAFSLDDQGTTEIDDAFSFTRVGEDEWRIGIHIAAPALGFAPGSAVDAIARERLSTAYLPGCKYTMLPQDVIECFSLDHGSHQPALSLYLNVSPADMTVRGHASRIEQVRIGANLRHAQYDVLNEGFESGARAGLPYEDELRGLWQLACALEKRRGKPSVNAAVPDYLFRVEGERVTIGLRRRGAPLDKLVSELMILANRTWGELLAERSVAAIYRVQSSGKVRLSVHPEAHDGLGVACYAWMTSPLRRYVDLVNQWQLAAALSGQRPPFARTSESLLGAMRAFELTAARYDEHQRMMESYWCLRWLQQEQLRTAEATVLRENLVRFEGLPLTTRVPSLPALDAGTRVRLELEGIDLIERSVACRFAATLGAPQAAVPPGQGAL